MIDCDYRLFPFCVLLVVGLYAATSRNYFRFVLINFRSDINRKRPTISESDSERPPCSFPMFREYLRQTKTNYLPGDGRWTRRGGKLARFHPDLCSLSYGSWVPRDRLARCFARLNISYVVILGDSNSMRLYKQIRRSFSAAGAVRIFNCDEVNPSHDHVITPLLPARRCSTMYYGLRRFLTPHYFRCNVTADRLPVASLLVQYLPIVNDKMSIHALHNSAATGCVDEKTSKFVHTRASILQVSTGILPCSVYCLGQWFWMFFIPLTPKKLLTSTVISDIKFLSFSSVKMRKINLDIICFVVQQQQQGGKELWMMRWGGSG